MSTRHGDLYFYEGEKPPPTPWRYQDENGNLITTGLSGATIVAKTSIDGAANVDVTCTNTGDGTGTIVWPTGTSRFILAGTIDGTIKIRLEVSNAPEVWSLPMTSVPVRKL